jgi:hypothetical protein
MNGKHSMTQIRLQHNFNNVNKCRYNINQKIEIEKFKQSIYELIDQICEICHRKFYQKGVYNFKLNDKIHRSFIKAGFEFNLNSKIITCHAFHSSLSSKLPSNKSSV